MRNNITELIFILDKSGSMCGLEDDTIGGFNSMLKKQKALEDKCYITTVLFNHNYKLVHNHIDIHKVKSMTSKDYFPSGSTALLDAIGNTIEMVVQKQREVPRYLRANKVMFIIITDGYENSSKDYSQLVIHNMIEYEKERYDWQFMFLAANIDAISTAISYGIDKEYATNYVPDKHGKLNFEVMSNTVSTFRSKGIILDNSMKQIKEDMKKRGNNN